MKCLLTNETHIVFNGIYVKPIDLIWGVFYTTFLSVYYLRKWHQEIVKYNFWQMTGKLQNIFFVLGNQIKRKSMFVYKDLFQYHWSSKHPQQILSNIWYRCHYLLHWFPTVLNIMQKKILTLISKNVVQHTLYTRVFIWNDIVNSYLYFASTTFTDKS